MSRIDCHQGYRLWSHSIFFPRFFRVLTCCLSTCCGHRNMRLLLLLQLVRAEIGVPGRYAHCAVTFADYMVVYGGRGFEAGRNSLSTLGCAMNAQQSPLAKKERPHAWQPHASGQLLRPQLRPSFAVSSLFSRRLPSISPSPHSCPSPDTFRLLRRLTCLPPHLLAAGTLGPLAIKPTRGLSSSRARARPTAPTRAPGTVAPWSTRRGPPPASALPIS